MAEKAYKFRLYPNKAQEELIRKTCGCARFVYNQTLVARQDAYKAGKSLSSNDCVMSIMPFPLNSLKRHSAAGKIHADEDSA